MVASFMLISPPARQRRLDEFTNRPKAHRRQGEAVGSTVHRPATIGTAPGAALIRCMRRP